MEKSLVIIKPDGTTRRRVSSLVLQTLLDRGYKIKAFKEMMVSESLAKKHYAVHSEKPFFPWLVDFISSAPVLAMIFESNNIIQEVRDTLGATFVQKASPDSLRGKYGIWAGINIAHASDAPDTAASEIALWTTEGGLVESPEAEMLAQKYIKKYIDGDVDYTMRLREVVKDAIENHDTSNRPLELLKDLLSKDAADISKDKTDTLAKVVFEFIIEEIEKTK
ncbi:MAG: nucleoside-diphosphate kinase [Candidatus Thorarchaeota archaeon]